MTKIIPIQEEVNTSSYYFPKLEGYIYENVFEDSFVNQLQNLVKKTLASSSKDTFFTHNTSFSYEGKTVYIGSHKQNAREQNVIYDLTLLPKYYYQTIDSITDWSNDYIKNNVSPIFQHCLKKIQSLPPFYDDKNNYILYRCHINYLPHTRWLGLHIDGNPTINSTVSNMDARMYSFTFYLNDHKEGLGGEFWSYTGFVYKPKKNSALLINGNKVLHGVTQNMDIEPRLAFTVRIMHKEDLYLPGQPDKWLWNINLP